MKNKGLKRFFAVFLSAAMSLSLYVTPVLAETTEETATETVEDVQMEWEAHEYMQDDNLVGDTATELPEIEENVSDVTLTVSGKSGDLDWKIDKDGTLTISGSGDYCSFGGSEGPEWLQYRSQIKKAVVTADNLTSTDKMFLNCRGLTSIDLSNFNTANVTDMFRMFEGCNGLTKLDVSKFNTANVTNMQGMFRNCSGLTKLDLSKFNTASVTDMSHMFDGCSSLTSIDVSKFNTASVTDMSNMFCGCSSLTSIDLSNFDTENVTSMDRMFWDCSGLTSIDLSNFNTKNVKNMFGMFSGCSGLRSIDLSKFNTENVTDMAAMFCGCSGLTSIDVSSFNTENVTGMMSMFSGCSSLKNLDLSKFNTKNKLNMSHMFSGCSSLTTLKVPQNITLDMDLPDEYNNDGGYCVYGTWEDENGTVCTQVTKNLPTPMTYTKVSDETPDQTPDSTPDQPNNDQKSGNNNNQTPSNNNNNNSSSTKPSYNSTTTNAVTPQGRKVASYQGNDFYQSSDGTMRCYDANGNMVKNNFKCDGTYTYFFQNDGTAMTDRLTYHPDGEHVIYFDENGHEVFSNFAHIKKSIAGDAVDDLCFFDVYGHMYVDFITYDQAGVNLYYANPYGVMEHNGWFMFSDGNIGYANADATLMTNQFSYDQFGRKVYFQGDGKLARGLISDGATYYQMDETDGHCLGEFPVQ